MKHDKILNGLKTEVAYRYYSRCKPERNYSRTAAQKQFIQDTNVDLQLVRKIIHEIYLEQKDVLK